MATANHRTQKTTLMGQRQVRFIAMTQAEVDVVAELEKASHSHPWSRGNLQDAVNHHHHAHMLVSGPVEGELATWHTGAGDVLLGYSVAMMGVDEAHLLNITVAPTHRRQGWATVMMHALAVWAQGRGAHLLWLEVRASNTVAQALYASMGFEVVGVRKRYYALNAQAREDAHVMRLPLQAWRMPK